MVDAPALRRLVGNAADFLDATWGRAPLHVAASSQHTGPQELLTIDDVDHLVAATGLRPPAFRLVRQGRTLPRTAVTRSVRIGSRPVDDLIDVAAVHREVAADATLVLQGLHRSHAPVASFCRDLERTLTHPVQANAYLTPPVARGLELHEDPHDVFAVQCHGTKRWVVHPPDRATPWDLELRPGDVLYLPAGIRHAAQTLGEPSLHLTLGVRTIPWRRLVQRVVDEVLVAEPQLGGRLPAAWADHPTDLEDRLTMILQRVAVTLTEGSDIAAVVADEAERFFRARPPDLTGGLRDIIELADLEDHTPLRRRADVLARIVEPEETDGERHHVEVALADRSLLLPAGLATALHRILDATRLRPIDLEDLMDGPSRLVLTRRLVREGVLAIERDPVGA